MTHSQQPETKRIQTVQSSRISIIHIVIFIILLSAGVDGTLNQWTYIEVRENVGHGWAACVGDVNGDGYRDICANQMIFINPKGDLTGTWQGYMLPEVNDGRPYGFFMYDVHGDGGLDIIAIRNNLLIVIEVDKNNPSSMKPTIVAEDIVSDHGVTEGYAVGDFNPGGKPEFAVSFNDASWHYYSIPPNPRSPWTKVTITSRAIDEGIAKGDIDGDGFVDVAGSRGVAVTWWKNPGNGKGNWAEYPLGGTVSGKKGVDRCCIADMDNDGDNDIYTVVHSKSDNVFWWENPGKGAESTKPVWKKHVMDNGVKGQGHAGDVGDIDSDGDSDAMASSTTSPSDLMVFENRGDGTFTGYNVLPDMPGDIHNTGVLADLDNDGDLDIIGIGWSTEILRIWRNDNGSTDVILPQFRSQEPHESIGGTIPVYTSAHSGRYRHRVNALGAFVSFSAVRGKNERRVRSCEAAGIYFPLCPRGGSLIKGRFHVR